VLIVGMLNEVSEALALDTDVEQVLCRYLMHGLQADVAVCFIPRPSGDKHILSGHPDRPMARALVASLDGMDLGDGRMAPALLQARGLGEVLLVAPPVFDPDDDGARRRVLAFARRDGFAEHQVMLLQEAIPPLMTVMPHAVAATERRERTKAGRDAAREFGLTGRELEVLELLSQGLLATSIASRLSLSPRTVHKHLGNIYDKLGVHDRLVAVSLARGRGLVAA
jgi:DNA-binding CsgD family transcriptional regulator